MSNTILITSDTGAVNRELVKALKAASANVIAMSSTGMAVEDVKTCNRNAGEMKGFSALYKTVTRRSWSDRLGPINAPSGEWCEAGLIQINCPAA